MTEIGSSVRTIGFLIVLAAAVWQDLRLRSLGRGFLLGSGIGGLLTGIFCGVEWRTAALSALVGILILLLGRATGDGIGEGDGWFFVVTGFFLEPGENLMLFLSGLFVSGIYGLVLAVSVFAGGGSVRRKRFPFLPCLIPMGLWLVFR